LKDVRLLLEKEVKARNSELEVSSEKPDPILIAKRHNDESIALICALFAYGNVKAIIKFLESLDFSLLEASDEVIEKKLSSHYYRFQNSQDIAALFIALKRLKDLLMPLDTHTFKVSQKLGLLTRKTYDMKAVLELTETLKRFDSLDPIKYDFALYRLGQEKII